ncbi:phosphoribosylglycinamide formyltransferase [Yinghuangia aomiensis]
MTLSLLTIGHRPRVPGPRTAFVRDRGARRRAGGPARPPRRRSPPFALVGEAPQWPYTPRAPGPARLVVLVSGSGSNLQALRRRRRRPRLRGRDRRRRRGPRGRPELARAEKARGFPVRRQGRGLRGPRRQDRALADAVAAYTPDLVVSAGFMKILGPEFLRRYEERTLNTHPRCCRRSRARTASATRWRTARRSPAAPSATVDAGVDTGPIVAQGVIAVEPDDDADGGEALHERIKTVERSCSSTSWAASPARVTASKLERSDSDHEHPGKLPEQRPIRRALVSVYDELGREGLARGAACRRVEPRLDRLHGRQDRRGGVPVTKVED